MCIRDSQTIVNEQAASEAPADAEAAAEGNVSSRLSAAALKKELELREQNMQAGDGAVTDQWRVYQHVVQQLQTSPPLRLMVQASRNAAPRLPPDWVCSSWGPPPFNSF